MNREERRRLQTPGVQARHEGIALQAGMPALPQTLRWEGPVGQRHGGRVHHRLICEGCTTQVDYAEAVANDSIHDYVQLDSGRMWAWHKDQRVRVMPMG